MKKIFRILSLGAIVLLSSCNQTVGWGNLTFNYCLVKSDIVGKKYFHIVQWKEYKPEGDAMNYYVGLEIKTASKNVYYFWEMNLEYILMKDYNSSYGTAIE